MMLADLRNVLIKSFYFIYDTSMIFSLEMNLVDKYKQRNIW